MKSFLLPVIFLLAFGVFGQGPGSPPPPPNNPGGGGSNPPVGGGTPLGEGIAVLMACAVLYGGRKLVLCNDSKAL